MAAEADSVVVSLIADTHGFDTTMKQSAAQFVDSSRQLTSAASDVENAADGVYTAHNKMGIATNNARIAQFELEHVIRGSVDSYASGAGAAQILAQHIASVAEAATFMGGSLGAVGEIISGPWGIALTAAIALGAGLLAKHKEENETLDTAVEKLKKHYDQTLLTNQADEIWGHTLDALIQKLDRLNTEGFAKLQQPNLVNQQAYSDAEKYVDSLNKLITKTEADPTSTEQQIDQLYQALFKAVANLRAQTAIFGGQLGEVFTDSQKAADDWAQHISNKITYITGAHPELGKFTDQIDAAFDKMKNAIDDAAKANVPFDKFTKQIDTLNQRLEDSPGFVKDYIVQLKALAAQLEAIASIKPEDAIKKFEAAVTGAEGTGKNRLGSSAEGIGQFMPDTWLQYFQRLFPQTAESTTRQYQLDQRNNPTTAKAVIEAAAQDYANSLKAAGITITEGSLYAVHLLSAGDPKARSAVRLLTAPSDEPTSDFLSARVLKGNPFLRGTAGSAISAINSRIGDSNAAVSTADVDMAKQLNEYDAKIAESVAKDQDSEQKISILKEGQVSLAGELIGHQQTIAQIIGEQILPSEAEWLKLSEQITASEKELKSVGGQIIDDVLNPDNWTSFGSAAHAVLHDIELEFIKLAAINPLKNLLLGENNPTLGSVFSTLFGGGGGLKLGTTAGNDAFASDLNFFGFASGGAVSGSGSSTSDSIPAMLSDGEYVLSADAVRRIGISNLDAINGGIRHFAGGGFVSPSNARALSPFGSMGPGMVLIGVQANDYFDAQVLKVSGPVIAQSSVAAANGGATIGRNRLATEAMHRL